MREIDLTYKKLNEKIDKYEKNILDNSFKVIIEYKNKKLLSKVIDLNTNLEYILVDTDQTGSFIGKVKQEYDSVIKDFLDNNAKPNIYKENNTKDITEYIDNKYNAKPEYLWDKYPTFSVYRNKNNNKWFALISVINENKLDKTKDNSVEIINIRYPKNMTEEIIDNKTYYKAYHMNKNSWITIKINNINIKDLYKLIDQSYDLSFNKNR